MNGGAFAANRLAQSIKQGRQYTINTRIIRDMQEGRHPVGMYGAQLAMMFKNMDLDTINRVVFVGQEPDYSGKMQTYHTSVDDLEKTLGDLGDLRDVAVLHIDKDPVIGDKLIVNAHAGEYSANDDLCDIVSRAGKDVGMDVAVSSTDGGEPSAVYEIADKMGAKAVSMATKIMTKYDQGELLGYIMKKL